jgi:hypothetical protein
MDEWSTKPIKTTDLRERIARWKVEEERAGGDGRDAAVAVVQAV